MKTITKKELQEQLEAANARVKGYQKTVEEFAAGRVSINVLALMIGTPTSVIETWISQGLPVTRTPPELFPRIDMRDVRVFLVNRAAQHELDNRKVAEDLLLAEIADLKTQLRDLQDDGIPPALPQAVVDALEEASDVIGENMDEIFSVLADFEGNTSYELEDEDGMVEKTRTLGMLKARIRRAIYVDFEHYADERLAVLRERNKVSEAKLAAANAELAESLAA